GAVTRHPDMLASFSDPQTFSSENTQAPSRPRPPAVQQVLDAGLSTRSGLSAIQPPDHTRLRAFVNKAFTPRRVAVLEPRIRELAERTVERMAPRGRADWVGELAYELPALVIFMLLGIPAPRPPGRARGWRGGSAARTCAGTPRCGDPSSSSS